MQDPGVDTESTVCQKCKSAHVILNTQRQLKQSDAVRREQRMTLKLRGEQVLRD